MAEPYQFNFQQPTPDYDLEALKRALMQGAQATQGLEAMTPDMENAIRLRELPRAEINRVTGERGLMNMIARATGQSKGHSDVRRLRPQEAALREQVGEAAGQESLFKLYNKRMEEERAAETQAMDREELVLGERRGVKEDEISAAELAIAQAEEGREVEESIYDISVRDRIDPEDVSGEYEDKKGNTIQVEWNPKLQKPVNVSSGLPVNLDNYRKVDDSGITRGKALGANDVTKLSDQASTARETNESVNDFKPSYSQIRGLPTSFINAFIQGAGRQDLLKYANMEGLDQEAKDAIQWWADWKMTYTLPNRHKWFGGTLTNNEQKAWDEAEAIRPGMDPLEVKKRLDHLNSRIQIRNKERINLGLLDPLVENRPIFKKLGEQSGYTYNEDANTYTIGDEPVKVEVGEEEVAIDRPDYMPPKMWTDLSKQNQEYLVSLPEEEIRELIKSQIADMPRSVLPKAKEFRMQGGQIVR